MQKIKIYVIIELCKTFQKTKLFTGGKTHETDSHDKRRHSSSDKKCRAYQKGIPFVDGFESSQMTIDIRLKRITVETGHTTFPSKKVHEFGLAYAKGNFPIKPSKIQMRISFENGRISLKAKKDEVSFPMNQIDFIRISKGEITLLNRRMAVLKKIAV